MMSSIVFLLSVAAAKSKTFHIPLFLHNNVVVARCLLLLA